MPQALSQDEKLEAEAVQDTSQFVEALDGLSEEELKLVAGGPGMASTSGA